MTGAWLIAFYIVGLTAIMYGGRWYSRRRLRAVRDAFDQVNELRARLGSGKCEGRFRGHTLAVSVIFHGRYKQISIAARCRGTVPFLIRSTRSLWSFGQIDSSDFDESFESSSTRPERFSALTKRGDVHALFISLLGTHKASSIEYDMGHGDDLVVLFKPFHRKDLLVENMRAVFSDLTSLVDILDNDAHEAQRAAGITRLNQN